MSRIKERIKRDILAKRGLEPGEYGKPIPVSINLPKGDHKTLTMKLIEKQLGLPLEVLLMDGDLNSIADRLGIHFTTVSKWRLRLGLRERKDA